MKRISQLSYSLFLLLLIISFSCRKQNDTYPKVAIISPAEGSSYSFGDTIRVKVEMTLRDGPVRVDILKGDQLQSFSQRMIADYGEEVDFELYFTNRYLAGGSYDLRVQVFNGENHSSDFVKLNLKELPLHFRGWVALTSTLNGTSNLVRMDSAGNVEQQNFGSSYPYLVFNSYQQRAVVAPDSAGNLKAFDFRNLDLQYQKPSVDQGSGRQYEFLQSAGQYIYTYENSGRIRVFDKNGEVIHSFMLDPNFLPLAAVLGSPGLLVAVKERGRSDYKIIILNPEIGTIRKSATIEGKVKDVIFTEGNVYSLIYSRNGNTVIATYDFDLNVVSKKAEIQNEVPQCLLGINNTLALISTDQKIRSFDPNIAIMPTVVYNFAASDMELEKAGGAIYFAAGYSLLVAPPGGVPNQIFTASDSIKQIEIAYNK